MTYFLLLHNYMDVIKQPLLSNSGLIDYGDVWIAVDDSVIDAQMPPLLENSAQYILDTQENVIYSKTNTINLKDYDVKDWVKENRNTEVVSKINGVQYILLSHKSNNSGLTFVSVQPQKIYNQKKISNIVYVLAAMSLAVAVGLFLSYYMSRKSATPISSLLKKIDKTIGDSRWSDAKLNTINLAFEDLISNNSKLEKVLEDQVPIVKMNIFNRLIYGDFVSEDEMKGFAEYTNFKIEKQFYVVVVFRLLSKFDIFSSEDNDLQKYFMISLEEVISNSLPDKLYLNNGNNQIVSLINFPIESEYMYKEKIENLVDRIISSLPSSISNDIFVFASHPTYDYSKISHSYKDVMHSVKNSKISEQAKIIWPSNGEEFITNYPPIDFSVKLSHYTISGDIVNLENELKYITDRYLLNDQLPFHLQNLVLSELQVIIIRLLDRLGMKRSEHSKYMSLMEENQHSNYIEQIYTTVGVFKQLCKEVIEVQNTENCENIIKTVKLFIDENYFDENLSLSSIASLFDISDTYLSTLFKDCLKVNLSSYVESVRIDKAKELLLTTSMSITEIARNVGYYSINSFSRAFKRVVGETATDYRNSNKI